MTNHIHPEELLAGYVDGTLMEDERAEVDAHLASCQTCREELDLARMARARLRDLPEVPVPVGVTRPVISEVSRQMARGAPSTWRSKVYAGLGVAAAIALVVGLVVSLPRLGRNAASPAGGGAGAQTAESAAGGAEATTPSRGVLSLEILKESFDDTKVRALAAQAAASAADQEQPAPATTAAALAAKSALDDAIACVERVAAPQPNDQLIRLIQAKWKGSPAYLAIYLTRPSAGQPPESVTVWVIDRPGCSTILSFAQQRLR